MNKTRVAVKAVIVCNGCFLLLERRQNGEEGIYDPVSYTHLTLPTT